MPEGNVLHRLAYSINDEFAGQIVHSSSPQGRFAAEAADITGRRLGHAEAYGKHLVVAFEGVMARVRVHLGLAGGFTFGAGSPPDSADTVRWRMEGDHGWADLRGPAACELASPERLAEVLDRLGPDPLRDDAEPERGWERVRTSNKTIGALLMDQRVTAGVGNIYRAEVLFRQHLDPLMPGKFLRHAEWVTIWDDLVELMERGTITGAIDTVRPEHMPGAMGRPPRVDAHGGEVYVYRREGLPCYLCGSPIRAHVLENRNLFWCPTCQPRHRRRKPN